MFALYSSRQDQIIDVIDAMSTNKRDANSILLQEEAIEKKNVQQIINKLQKLYKFEEQIIKRLIL